jgi:uroporphyrin-III C-methyltransferase
VDQAAQEADVVLYDDLSAGPILDLAREGAELISVGKRAGRASPRQDHVSRLLVDHARTGARVVRLKSGDAGIFGRLEEEITACAPRPGSLSRSCPASPRPRRRRRRRAFR